MAAGVLKSLGELTFQISPDLSGFAAQLNSGMSLAVGSTVGTIGALFEGLGKAMLKKFTLPLAIGAAANIAQFQALDREIRSTITLLGTGPGVINAVFDEFSGVIARVSTEVGGLERDIADGLYQAISAGVPRGGIEDFLNIAQMSAIADKTADLTTAVDGLTTASNAFSEEGLTFAQIADIMFATVAKGKTTMGELSQSIGRAAGIAANAGVKFAEFQAIIGTLTLGGFKTAEAISFMRAAITGLLRPSEEMDKIFQELGFQTAELAIPVIGLQPAFQAVVDAAGGSTSKLQELIGTSEGVSAILGVTGSNAEKFAGVLDATANAAGFLGNAFEIAEGGVGRSFGRMTEAFDRLGNRLGAIASEIAAPFVEIITDIVNRVIGAFQKLMPVVDTLIDIFKTFASVLELPGLKAIVAGLTAMVILFGSLLGVIAPVLIALGLLLKTAVALRALIVVTKAWGAANVVVQATVKPLLSLYQRLLALLAGIFPRAVKKSTASMVGFTAAAQKAKFALSPLALGGAILAITAAIALGIVAYRLYKDAMGRIDNQAFLTKRGIDTLADSMDIVLEPAAKLASIAAGGLTTEFVLKNTDTIKRINDIQLTLGNIDATKYVAGILLQFSNRGATPEELEQLLQNLQDATEQTFVIDVNSLGAETSLEALGVQFDFIEEMAREWAKDFDTPPKHIVADLKEIAEQLVTIQNTEGPKAFTAAVDEMRVRFEGLPGAVSTVSKEVFAILERDAERTFGFDTGDFFVFDNLLTFDDLMEQLATNVPAFFNTIGDGVEVFDEDVQNLSENTRKYLQLIRSGEGDTFLSPEAKETVKSLGDELASSFKKAEDAINAAFQVIEDRAIASVPFLDVFKVSELDIDAVLEGQHLFDTLAPQITALKEDFIKNTTPEGKAFYEKFLSLSAPDQAALALLSPADLDRFVEHTIDNFEAAFASAGAEKEFSAEGILAPIQTQLEEDLQAVVDKGAEAGTAISAAVNEQLVAGGEMWVATVAEWITNTGKALVSTEFGGTVSLGGPAISAFITINQNQVNVTSSPSASPGDSVRRALLAGGHLP